MVELRGYRGDIRLARDELEDLIRLPLDGVIAALDELTERNGIAPTGLAALALVGGGAGIPLVTQRLSEHTRLPVVTTPQPALNAAVGAALFAAFGADADAPTGAAAAADDADAPTGAAAAADAPTGAAAAATDATAAAAVFDGLGADAPGSATFRALAWSQDDGGDEPVPYTGENPYQLTDSDLRPSVQYVPATGPIFEEPRRRWHRMAQLVIGVAAVIAIIAVGGVAYALTSATESTRATEESGVEPPKPKPPEPKPPEPEPPSPPKESPEPATAPAGATQRGNGEQRSAAATAVAHPDDGGAHHHHENDHDDVADDHHDVSDHDYDVSDHDHHHDNDHQHHPVDDDELHQGPVRAGAGADPGP